MHTVGVNITYFGSSSCLKAGASSPGLRHVLACFAHFFLPKRLSNPRELTTHYFGTWKKCWSWQAWACPPHKGCLPDPQFGDIQLQQIFISWLRHKGLGWTPKEKEHDTIPPVRSLIVGVSHRHLHCKVWSSFLRNAQSAKAEQQGKEGHAQCPQCLWAHAAVRAALPFTHLRAIPYLSHAKGLDRVLIKIFYFNVLRTVLKRE